MIVYVDIGNTNIKLHFDGKYISFATKGNYTVDSLFNEFPSELKNIKPSKVMLSSVVPSKQKLIIGISKKYWGTTPINISYPLKTGIKINVDEPKNIGSDIVCLAAYASSQTDEAIIVNMGTTTTITHVISKEIKGVIIIPGFITSLESLVSSAAKISEIDLFLPNKNIGKNTDEAISIGMINGHVHMIKGFVDDINKDATLLLSGGNSKLISKYLPEFKWIKEATIEGMKVIEKIK